MTACSTLLSPLMTPLAMKLLAGTYVPIDAWAMMQSILTMIIAPLVVGLAIHHFLPAWAAALRAVAATDGDDRHLPSHRHHGRRLAGGIAHHGSCVVAQPACHNATGYILGFGIARGRGLESHRLPNRGHRGRHAERRHGHRAGVPGSQQSRRRTGLGGVRAVERGHQFRAGVAVADETVDDEVTQSSSQ